MTKSLTEQWREGTLPEGWYYTIITGFTDKEKMMIDYFIPELNHFEIKPTRCIKEVVATVPSYDEVKEMSQNIERLELDNEALEMAHNEGKEINAELVSKTEQLEKQLAIATKALNCCYRSMHYWARMTLRDCKIFCVIDKALKEIEEVK